jgi:hypothetical protein
MGLWIPQLVTKNKRTKIIPIPVKTGFNKVVPRETIILSSHIN